jgi:hypothetical protein
MQRLPSRVLFNATIQPGDANWDRVIGSGDYAIVADSLRVANVIGGQSRGDFNDDRSVDIDDLAIIDFTAGRAHSIFDIVGPKGDRSEFTTYSGKITLDTDGAVLENFVLTGGAAWIEVAADNVTIRNFIIHGGWHQGSAIGSESNDFQNLVVQDGEIYGGEYGTAVKISNGVAERLYLHDLQADAFRVKSNAIIRNNYAHDIGLGDGSHGDVVQMFPTDGGDNTVIGNYFDATGANACLFQVDNGWRVEGNFFAGGNYAVQCEGTADNLFLRNTWKFGSYQYGPVTVGSGDRDLLVWQGNVATTGDGMAVLIAP